jgi:hypothetical protein
MRKRFAALLLSPLIAASTMACLVDFGCDDGRYHWKRLLDSRDRVERCVDTLYPISTRYSDME